MSKIEHIERGNDGTTKRLKKEERKDYQSLITIFPLEIIEQILRRVAATSPINLALCRMRERNDGAMKFLDLCIAKGNPTALFERALLMCGAGMNLMEGIDLLEKASNKGHDIATYLLGLMLTCRRSPEHERIRGMNLIQNLKDSIGEKIISFQLQLELLVGQRKQWYRAQSEYMLIKINTGHHKHKCKELLNSWICILYHSRIGIEIDNDICESCIWDLESRFFNHLYG